jgi:isochorismate hydrolase
VFVIADACASNTQENHDFTINNILPTICYVASTKDALKALK